MNATNKFAALLLVSALSVPVFAQPRAMPASGAEGGAQADLGMERKVGKGMRFNKGNTRGWALMTADERTAHREKMLAAKTYDECKAIQNEHHQTMEARAKEKSQTLPAPRQNACDRMQTLGKFK